MTHVPRTVTVPERKRPPVLDDPDLVTAIREYGRSAEYPLLSGRGTFTIGSSPSCDISIPSEYISSLHCVLERRGQHLRVHDQASRNGTFFRGRRETNFDIGPGDTFILATTALLALNDPMRLARPALAQVLGYSGDVAVDDVLSIAVQDGPILIIGQEGARQSLLVQSIHDASLRRGHALLELSGPLGTRDEQKQLLQRARRGTLSVGVTGVLLDEAFLDMAMSAEFRVRLVVLAPSLEAGVQSVKLDALTRMTKIEIRPLCERRSELGALIDHLFIEALLSLRMSDLTAENQRALHAYHWPGNLDELHETVTWIAAIVREGSVRKAATALAMPRSTLQYWMERLHLALPLTRELVQ